MTPEVRETLAEELAALDKAEDAIRVAMKPFSDALLAVETLRENLLEKHGTDHVGSCETCGRALFEGDLGYSYSDAEVKLCAEHAPTYADWKRTTEGEPEAYDSLDHLASAKKQIADHLAAGGSLDDKVPLFPL